MNMSPIVWENMTFKSDNFIMNHTVVLTACAITFYTIIDPGKYCTATGKNAIAFLRKATNNCVYTLYVTMWRKCKISKKVENVEYHTIFETCV